MNQLPWRILPTFSSSSFTEFKDNDKLVQLVYVCQPLCSSGVAWILKKICAAFQVKVNLLSFRIINFVLWQ